MLKKFNEVVPGLADRIVRMAENQSQHRRDMERIVIQSGARDSRLGILAGLAISSGFLGIAFYAIKQGHVLAGSWIGTINVAALAGVFVYGTRSRRRERDSRHS